MDATSKCLNDTIDLLSWFDDSFDPVLVDVRRERERNFKLVRVRVRGLCLSKSLDLPRTKLKILLGKRRPLGSDAKKEKEKEKRSFHPSTITFQCIYQYNQRTLGERSSSFATSSVVLSLFGGGGRFAEFSALLASFSRCFWRRLSSLRKTNR